MVYHFSDIKPNDTIFLPHNVINKDTQEILQNSVLRPYTYINATQDSQAGYGETLQYLKSKLPNIIPQLEHYTYIREDHYMIACSNNANIIDTNQLFNEIAGINSPLGIDHPTSFTSTWGDTIDITNEYLDEPLRISPEFRKLPVFIDSIVSESHNQIYYLVKNLPKTNTQHKTIPNFKPFADSDITINATVISVQDYEKEIDDSIIEFTNHVNAIEDGGDTGLAEEIFEAADSIRCLLFYAQAPEWTGPALLITLLTPQDHSTVRTIAPMTTTTSTTFINKDNASKTEWAIPEALLSDADRAHLKTQADIVDVWEYFDAKGKETRYYSMSADKMDTAFGRSVECHAKINITEKVDGKYVAIAMTVAPTSTPAPATTTAIATTKPEIHAVDAEIIDTTEHKIIITPAYYSRHSLYPTMKRIVEQTQGDLKDRYQTIINPESNINRYGYVLTVSEYHQMIDESGPTLAEDRDYTKFNNIKDMYICDYVANTTPTHNTTGGTVMGTTANSGSTYPRSTYGGYSGSTYSAAPTAEMINAPPMPIVHISGEALARMGYYVGLCDDEIGWLGTMRRTPSSIEGGAETLTVEEVFLLRQGVHATTTELEASAIGEMSHQIMEEDNYDVDRVNRLLVWGHSHVRMGTSPSGQDDSQMRVFKDNDAPYMMRIIANKHGDIRVDFFDYDNNIKWERLPWAEEPDPAVVASAEAELALLDLSGTTDANA